MMHRTCTCTAHDAPHMHMHRTCTCTCTAHAHAQHMNMSRHMHNFCMCMCMYVHVTCNMHAHMHAAHTTPLPLGLRTACGAGHALRRDSRRQAAQVPPCVRNTPTQADEQGASRGYATQASNPGLAGRLPGRSCSAYSQWWVGPWGLRFCCSHVRASPCADDVWQGAWRTGGGIAPPPPPLPVTVFQVRIARCFGSARCDAPC
jgi:hypothetical protein